MFFKLIRKSLTELLVSFIGFIDFILPDLTILSYVRPHVFFPFGRFGFLSAIRRGSLATNLFNLSIGKGTRINTGNLFQNEARIIIGDNCAIGINNLFITSGHHETGAKKFYAKPIIIRNNVWIASNCVILPNTYIGDNVILASGAVAHGVLESGFVYAGVPAKPIRRTGGIV